MTSARARRRLRGGEVGGVEAGEEGEVAVGEEVARFRKRRGLCVEPAVEVEVEVRVGVRVGEEVGVELEVEVVADGDAGRSSL